MPSFKIPKKDPPEAVSMKTATASEMEGKTCMICFQDFGENEETQCTNAVVYTTTEKACKCQILIGKGCITEWFNENRKCPICRTFLGARPAPVPPHAPIRPHFQVPRHAPVPLIRFEDHEIDPSYSDQMLRYPINPNNPYYDRGSYFNMNSRERRFLG